MKTRKLKFRAIMFLLVVCIITSTIHFQRVDAVLNSNLPVSYIDDNFPESYKPYIDALKAKHPKWIFKAVHTGLDWNTVLSHETYEVNDGISLVEDIFAAEWKRDGQNYYRDGNYVTASKQAVAYVLDPRNFINENGIFQFEALRYVAGVQTVDAVQGVLGATPMGGEYKSRYKLNGTWHDLGTTYAELIHSISAQVGINPVHIASRIRQENSGNILNNSLINGDYGIYNFFNIGAYDTSTAGAIANGAQYARDHGWTDVASGLRGGITYIYDKYVKWGQNTIYFERFDVNNPGNAQWLLGTGYMTNIFGAKNEALMTYNAYNGVGLIDSSFEFDIPVYDNMPAEPSSIPLPGDVSFSPDNTRVYLDDPSDSGATDEFWIRTGPDTIATVMEVLYETRDGQENRTKFTRIGIGNNTLYDKIRYDDGRIGYILKKWIYEYKYEKVQSVSLNTTYSEMSVGDTLQLNATVLPNNAEDKSVKWSSSDPLTATVDNNGKVTALKDGVVTITVTTNDQGKTAICTLNIASTKVTSIHLGSSKYTMYAGNTLTITPVISPSTAKNKNYRIESKNPNIVRIDNKKLIAVSQGETTVTFITEDGNHTAQARIVVMPSENMKEININEPLKLDNNIISKVDVNNNTVSDINKYIKTDYDINFVSIDNVKLENNQKVGTGTKVQFKENGNVVVEYEIIIYGDVDGSGIINARDLLVLQRYILGKTELAPIQVKASIIDKTSSEPRAADLLKIQRHILGLYTIEQ